MTIETNTRSVRATLNVTASGVVRTRRAVANEIDAVMATKRSIGGSTDRKDLPLPSAQTKRMLNPTPRRMNRLSNNKCFATILRCMSYQQHWWCQRGRVGKCHNLECGGKRRATPL